MAKKKSTPTPKPKRKPPSNGTVGNISNSAFVQGENHGTVIAVNCEAVSADDLSCRVNDLISRVTQDVLSTVESNYNRKRGESE